MCYCLYYIKVYDLLSVCQLYDNCMQLWLQSFLCGKVFIQPVYSVFHPPPLCGDVIAVNQ